MIGLSSFNHINTKLKKKISTRKILDYVPLAIMTYAALNLIWNRVYGDIGFQARHIIALILLPLIFYFFSLNHKLGVVGLGGFLLCGLFGGLSLSPAITTIHLEWTPGDIHIPVFYGQPIFLLWIAIHLAISAKYYFAVATKKYWEDIIMAIKNKYNPIPNQDTSRETANLFQDH